MACRPGWPEKTPLYFGGKCLEVCRACGFDQCDMEINAFLLVYYLSHGSGHSFFLLKLNDIIMVYNNLTAKNKI